MTKYTIRKGGYLNATRFPNIETILDKNRYNDDLTLNQINNIDTNGLTIEEFSLLVANYAKYIYPNKILIGSTICDDSLIAINRGDPNSKIYIIKDNQEIIENSESFVHLDDDITNPFTYFKQNNIYSNFVKNNIEAQLLIRMNKLDFFKTSESELGKYYDNFFGHLHEPTILFNPFHIMLNCNLLHEYETICNNEELLKKCGELSIETLKDGDIYRLLDSNKDTKIHDKYKEEYKSIYKIIKDIIEPNEESIINAISLFQFKALTANMIYEIKKNEIEQQLIKMHEKYLKNIIFPLKNPLQIPFIELCNDPKECTIRYLNMVKNMVVNNALFNYVMEKFINNINSQIFPITLENTSDYRAKRKVNDIYYNFRDKISDHEEILEKVYELFWYVYTNVSIKIREINVKNIPIDTCIISNNTLDYSNAYVNYIYTLTNIPENIIKQSMQNIDSPIEYNINEDLAKINKMIDSINQEIVVTKNTYFEKFIYYLFKLLKARSKINNSYPSLNFTTLIDHIYLSKLMKKKLLSISNTRILQKYCNLTKNDYKDNIAPIYDYLNDYINPTSSEYVAIVYKRPKEIPDCFETGIRNFINSFIYENQECNYKKLPPTTLDCVKQFYISYPTYNQQNNQDIGHLHWITLIRDNILEKLKKKVINDTRSDYNVMSKIMDKEKKIVDRGDIRSSSYYFAIILAIIFGIDYNSLDTSQNSIDVFLKNLFKLDLFSNNKIYIRFKTNPLINTGKHIPLDFLHILELTYKNCRLETRYGHCDFSTLEKVVNIFEYSTFENMILKEKISFNFLSHYYHTIQHIGKSLKESEIKILLYIANDNNFNFKTLDTKEFKTIFCNLFLNKKDIISFFNNSDNSIKKDIFAPLVKIKESNHLYVKFLGFLFYYYKNNKVILQLENHKQNKPVYEYDLSYYTIDKLFEDEKVLLENERNKKKNKFAEKPFIKTLIDRRPNKERDEERRIYKDIDSHLRLENSTVKCVNFLVDNFETIFGSDIKSIKSIKKIAIYIIIYYLKKNKEFDLSFFNLYLFIKQIFIVNIYDIKYYVNIKLLEETDANKIIILNNLNKELILDKETELEIIRKINESIILEKVRSEEEIEKIRNYSSIYGLRDMVKKFNKLPDSLNRFNFSLWLFTYEQNLINKFNNNINHFTIIYLLYTILNINKSTFAYNNNIAYSLVHSNLIEDYLHLFNKEYNHIFYEMFVLLLIAASNDMDNLEKYENCVTQFKNNGIVIKSDYILDFLQNKNIKLIFKNVDNKITLNDLARKYFGCSLLGIIFNQFKQLTIPEILNYFEDTDNVIIYIINKIPRLNNMIKTQEIFDNISFKDLINDVNINDNIFFELNNKCINVIYNNDNSEKYTFYDMVSEIMLFLVKNSNENNCNYLYKILNNIFEKMDFEFSYGKCLKHIEYKSLEFKRADILVVIMVIVSNLDTIQISLINMGKSTHSLITNYKNNKQTHNFNYSKIVQLVNQTFNKNPLKTEPEKEILFDFIKNDSYYYVWYTLFYMKVQTKNERIRRRNAKITKILKNFDNFYNTFIINNNIQNITHEELVNKLMNALPKS